MFISTAWESDHYTTLVIIPHLWCEFCMFVGINRGAKCVCVCATSVCESCTPLHPCSAAICFWGSVFLLKKVKISKSEFVGLFVGISIVFFIFSHCQEVGERL